MPPFFDRMTDGDGRTAFSGLVIDADKGLILTADHPTQGASQLLVTFPDGHERLTTQIRRDPRSGLALLVVDMQGLHSARVNWGDPAKLEVGDWLIALGQPGVGDPSMSVGVFSTRRRGGGEELIETDAAITRVGAGGILINLNGEVVGICKLGGRRADGFEGMGHAIPADRARRVVDYLSRFGQVRRPYLGVTVEPVDPATAGRRGPAAGVRVVTVGPGTPAAEAGLRQGDVILAVGQRPVDSGSGVHEAVEAATIGEELTLDIERQGQRMEIKVRPRAMPGPMGAVRSPRPGTTIDPGRDPSQGGPALPGSPPAGPGGRPLSPPASPGVPSFPPEP
jgi:serine protease Do